MSRPRRAQQPSQSCWWPRGCCCHPMLGAGCRCWGGQEQPERLPGAVRSWGSSFPASSIIPVIIWFLDQGCLLNLAPLALPFRPPASTEGFISCRHKKEIEWKNVGHSPPGRRGWGYPASEVSGDAGPAPNAFRTRERCCGASAPSLSASGGSGWWCGQLCRLGRVRLSVPTVCAGWLSWLRPGLRMVEGPQFWDGCFYFSVILK